MKKITTLLLMLTLAVAAHAQFQQGKAYLGASLTGVDLNYTGKNGLNLGIEGKAGYLLEDNWMVLAQASLKHTGSSDAASSFTAGIGGRYYIVQNGLYLGANLKYLQRPDARSGGGLRLLHQPQRDDRARHLLRPLLQQQRL